MKDAKQTDIRDIYRDDETIIVAVLINVKGNKDNTFADVCHDDYPHCQLYAVNVGVGFATFQTIIKGLVKAFFCLTSHLETRPLNPENSARLISRIAKTIHCSMW